MRITISTMHIGLELPFCLIQFYAQNFYIIKTDFEISTVAKPRAVVVCKAREEHAETSELAR